MATETVSRANHKHAHAHNGASSGDHESAGKPKARSLSAGNSSKRRTHGRGIKKTAGRLAGALSLGHLTTHGAEEVSDHLTELREKGLKTAEAAKQRIVKHPMSSVLIAFGAGYVWARLRKWF